MTYKMMLIYQYKFESNSVINKYTNQNMDRNELIFNADCAINFDDLGQFKDYTEDIETTLQNLIDIKTNQNTTLNTQMLREILKADPEDTFHAPAFKDLVSVILQILTQRREYFQNTPQLYKLIFGNLIQILQDSFISYQFSQQTGPKICSFIIDESKRKQFTPFEKTSLLICLSKLSKKLSYIDDLQLYSQLLYHSLDEQQIIIEKDANEEWKRMMLNVYCEVIQLSMRNRRVRQLLGTKLYEQSMLTLDHLWLGYKLSLWQRDEAKTLLYLKRMQTQLLTNYQVFQLAVHKLT